MEKQEQPQEHPNKKTKRAKRAKNKGTRALHDEAIATIQRLETLHPDLRPQFEKAYAYAVFPSVGRASAVLGISFGRGIVFEQERPIGVASLTQLTLGVQVGGQTFSELIFFPNEESLGRLKSGEYAFDGNASAVLVKAAATGTTDFKGVTAKAYSTGGLLLELSIGFQKLGFVEGAPVQESPVHVHEGRHAAPRGNGAEAGAEPAAAKPAEAKTREAAPAGESEESTPRGAEASSTNATSKNGSRSAALRERARAFADRLHLERAVPQPIKERVTGTMEKLRGEQTASKLLHPESQAALSRMLERDDTLREKLEKAYGYAIFPSVGKTSLVLGASYGRGEVFKKGKLIGYAGIVQLTIGIQVGGDTFSELILFEDASALERFKEGKVAFAANASAVIVRAGAAASNSYKGGTQVFVAPHGGMLLEVAIGGQKFVYRSAALTRGKTLRTDGPPPPA